MSILGYSASSDSKSGLELSLDGILKVRGP